MDKDLVRNKVEYIVIFISEFSRKHKLTMQQTYRYLKKFGVFELMEKCYDSMHTQSFDDMVIDITNFCQRKGGELR